MNTLGVSDEKVESIFKILASILHMGNLSFSPAKSGSDGSIVENVDLLQIIADLLMVSKEALNKAFTEKTMLVQAQTLKIPLKVDQAADTRDALVKTLYVMLYSFQELAQNF